MKYVGIDIGGMSIKAGVVDGDGSILARKTIQTDKDKQTDEIVKDIARLIFDILAENGIALQLKAIYDGPTLLQQFGSDGNYMHIVFKAD